MRIVKLQTILLSVLLLSLFLSMTACGSKAVETQPSTEPAKEYVSYVGIEDGNDYAYSVENTPPLKKSPIAGNTYYFLGSSVTLGIWSKEESMADYLAKRNNCTVVKSAVSGTSLADIGEDTYVDRLSDFDSAAKIDGFFGQLSTNDANLENKGMISDSTNRDDFDTATTYGALEYILSYAKETWNCPVYLFSNPYYENEGYAEMVETAEKIAKKWDVYYIDLYRDEAFNDLSSADKMLYMKDSIHPMRAGYRLWWTPVFEDVLYANTGA